MFRRTPRRLAVCFAICACLLCSGQILPVLTPPAQAIDAQDLFRRSSGSVVVVVGKSASGKDVSLGTGFYIKPNLVVTNNHVVEKASRIEIRQGGEEPTPVRRIKARDTENDLAILEVGRPGQPLPLKTTHPAVGEEVIAIGNPSGLERTVSPGIVSGLRKDEDENLRYQITAPISPGSSGGPILDAKGQVIGLATFYIMFGQNLNFAVPSLYVDKLMGGGGGGKALKSGPQKQIRMTKDEDGVITIQ